MQSDDESPFDCNTIRTARSAQSDGDDEAWIELDWEISLPNWPEEDVMKVGEKHRLDWAEIEFSSAMH